MALFWIVFFCKHWKTGETFQRMGPNESISQSNIPLSFFKHMVWKQTNKQTTITCVSAPQRRYSARCSAAMLTHVFAVEGGITGRWGGRCSASSRHLHLRPPLNKSSSSLGGRHRSPSRASLPRAVVFSSTYHEGAPGYRAAFSYPLLFKYIRVTMFYIWRRD